jgi:17beta-estradiol 17-dehydrogenase / very-long-chain 3-oxoacyl-CoA reductase
LDIAVLVNNVGMSYKYPDFFHTFATDSKTINDMVYCNVVSVTKMTAIVIPGMVERGKGGVIINNSSASGRIPTPLLTVYSSTKAFVDFFSRGLNIEYKSKGIIVQSICPYFVSTKLSAMRPSLIAPKPNQYVTSALNTVSSQSVTNGCLIHNIQVKNNNNNKNNDKKVKFLLFYSQKRDGCWRI